MSHDLSGTFAALIQYEYPIAVSVDSTLQKVDLGPWHLSLFNGLSDLLIPGNGGLSYDRRVKISSNKD